MQMRGVAALPVAALVALPVDAHEGATGFAKERMDAMSGMGRAMKEINRRISPTATSPASTRARQTCMRQRSKSLSCFRPAAAPG